MKRLIRSNTILSATKYKATDPRLPIIKAMEDVLGIEFRGNKPDWSATQYSSKYDYDVQYTINTKPGYGGKRRYIFYLTPATDEREVQDLIVRDMKDYILDNFGDDLEVATYGGIPPLDKHYELACDEYRVDKETLSNRKTQENEARDVYYEVDSILKHEGYDVKSYKSYSNYVCIFVKVKILDESVEQDAKDIEHILKQNGFHLKSVDIQYGRAMYPATWVEHMIRVNVYYN